MAAVAAALDLSDRTKWMNVLRSIRHSMKVCQVCWSFRFDFDLNFSCYSLDICSAVHSRQQSESESKVFGDENGIFNVDNDVTSIVFANICIR